MKDDDNAALEVLVLHIDDGDADGQDDPVLLVDAHNPHDARAREVRRRTPTCLYPAGVPSLRRGGRLVEGP